MPLLGDVNYTTQGLLAMDRWLSAVEKDRSTKALSQKIIADKPGDIHDQCTDGLGQVIPSQSVCQLINPVFSTPRIVAGESIATDVKKCQLGPLRRSDYLPAVQFTDEEWAELQKAFPTGVCDWGKRGRGPAADDPVAHLPGRLGEGDLRRRVARRGTGGIRRGLGQPGVLVLAQPGHGLT